MFRRYSIANLSYKSLMSGYTAAATVHQSAAPAADLSRAVAGGY